MYSVLLCYLGQLLSTESNAERRLGFCSMIKRQRQQLEKLNINKNSGSEDTFGDESKYIPSRASNASNTTSQKIKIDSFHEIKLCNKFAEMVYPYINDFKKITEENIKNIKVFTEKTVFAIIFKSTSHKRIDFMTELIDKLILECENSSSIKSMYHASRVKEYDVISRYKGEHYKTNFQDFQFYFTKNQIVDEIKTDKKYTLFRKSYDIDLLKIFQQKHLNSSQHINIIMDNCCKEKDDYFFSSQLIEGMIAQFKGYSNVIILSLKLEHSKLIDILKSVITDLLKDDLRDCNFYTSQIININNTYKIQVKNLIYDNEQKTINAKNIKYEDDKYLQKKYDLINRNLTKDMNIYEINTSRSINDDFDKKLFQCDDVSDINNLKITIHNSYDSYEYNFFRKIIKKGKDELTINYIGSSLNFPWGYSNNWACAEFEYKKVNGIYICHKYVNVDLLIQFFDYAKNMLLKNQHGNYGYRIMELNSNENNSLAQKPIISIFWQHYFFIKYTYELLNQNLFYMFEIMNANDWKIQIFDRKYDSEKHITDHPTNEFDGRFIGLRPWNTWSVENNEIIIKYLSSELFIRISHNKFGHETKFYVQIKNNGLTYEKNRHMFNFYSKIIKKQCKDFFVSACNNDIIENIINFKNTTCSSIILSDLIEGFFESLDGKVHDLLLFHPCFRILFFRNEFFKYIINNEYRDRCERETFEFSSIEFPFELLKSYIKYEIAKDDHIAINNLCNRFAFDKVCEFFQFTEMEKIVVNNVITLFCSFYELLESELTQRKDNNVGAFRVKFNFVTYIPPYLLNDLSLLFKKYLYVDIYN